MYATLGLLPSKLTTAGARDAMRGLRMVTRWVGLTPVLVWSVK